MNVCTCRWSPTASSTCTKKDSSRFHEGHSLKTAHLSSVCDSVQRICDPFTGEWEDKKQLQARTQNQWMHYIYYIRLHNESSLNNEWIIWASPECPLYWVPFFEGHRHSLSSPSAGRLSAKDEFCARCFMPSTAHLIFSCTSISLLTICQHLNERTPPPSPSMMAWNASMSIFCRRTTLPDGPNGQFFATSQPLMLCLCKNSWANDMFVWLDDLGVHVVGKKTILMFQVNEIVAPWNPA